MSKQNRKPKTYTMRPAQVPGPAKPDRPARTKNVDFGTPLDLAFEQWIQTDVIKVGQSRDNAVALALSAWLGRNDANLNSLSHCWMGSYFIQQFLVHFGISSTVATVHTEILHNGNVVDFVGSPVPFKANSNAVWNGHALLVIPEMSMLIDPTIGQSPYLGRQLAWQLPVKKVDPLLSQVPSHGSQILVVKSTTDHLEVRYTFLSQTPEYEKSARGLALIEQVNSDVPVRVKESGPGMLQILDGNVRAALESSLSRL